MKNKIIFVIILICSLLAMYKCNYYQGTSSDKQIDSMLICFYKSYITEFSKVPNNEEKLNFIRSKYCTSNLLRKIEKQFRENELDYDPFIKAQDCDLNWLKTLTVKKDSIKNNLYKVSFIDNFENTPVNINLIIIKEMKSFKIDSIW